MALLLSTFILLPRVFSTTCDVIPLQLPIKDVQVMPNITDSFMKGIPATIGSPPQDIVFLPWPELNNTWLYDEQAYCDPTVIFDDIICQVRRGNFYLEDTSTSFAQALDVPAAGGASQETQDSGAENGIKKLIASSIGGTDRLNIASTVALSQFPIGIPRLAWDAGYTTLHALGFGANSTYLNALLGEGRIGSRVWSIFWGRMWTTDNPMDGSIVLGGYDQKKVLGQNHTQQLDYTSTGCWTGLSVDIADIKVNFRDGTDGSIFPPNTVLPCCIVPQRQLLAEVPASVYTDFETVTNTSDIGVSFGLHWSAHLFDEGDAFDGDITFKLTSGLEIRIPNDQYVVPFVTIDRNGSRIFNDSQREVLINGVGSQPASLGRYFLTGAYLMVNQDSNTFTIWQANPSASSDLISVLDEGTASACSSNTTGIVQPSSTSLPTGKSASSSSSSHLSSGAIAGIVIAVLVGVAAAVALIFNKFRARAQPADLLVPPSGSYETDASYNGPYKDIIPHELQGAAPTYHEVHGNERAVYELDEQQQGPRSGVA